MSEAAGLKHASLLCPLSLIGSSEFDWLGIGKAKQSQIAKCKLMQIANCHSSLLCPLSLIGSLEFDW